MHCKNVMILINLKLEIKYIDTTLHKSVDHTSIVGMVSFRGGGGGGGGGIEICGFISLTKGKSVCMIYK